MAEMSARQVAARLGVRLDTVYAYVSRGVLSSRREPASRRSVFDSEEVEALARRGRPRRSTTPAALDLVVETALTTIEDHRILYRGRNAARLAQTRSFEDVAQWLWTGRDGRRTEPWTAYGVRVPRIASARDRMRAAVVLAAARADDGAPPEQVAPEQVAPALIATMVEALPVRSADKTDEADGSIAGRLWARLTDVPPTPAMVGTLNAALVLLADHELASSTMAVRIAASVRADPFSIVLAGLGPLAGALHGSASASAHRMLAEALEVGSRRALEGCASFPAWGHRLYPDGDPRAVLLLGRITKAFPGSRVPRVARDLARAGRDRGLGHPNVDFALGALSQAAGMPEDAGETVFTIARTAGWIAHAIEESDEAPLRYRARAVPRA